MTPEEIISLVFKIGLFIGICFCCYKLGIMISKLKIEKAKNRLKKEMKKNDELINAWKEYKEEKKEREQ